MSNTYPFSPFTGLGLGICASSLKQVGPINDVVGLGQAKLTCYTNVMSGNLFLRDYIFKVVEKNGTCVIDQATDNSAGLIELGYVYNSQVSMDTPQLAWKLICEKRLQPNNYPVEMPKAGATVQLMEGDGHVTTFTATGKDTYYYAPACDGKGQRYIYLDVNPTSPSFNQCIVYDPGRHETEYYNQQGQLIKRTNNAGQSITFEYDNNLLSAIISQRSGMRYEFNRLVPNQVSIISVNTTTNETTQLSRYTFDATGRLLTTELNPHSQNPYVISYVYEGAWHYLQTVKQSDGTSISIKNSYLPNTNTVRRIDSLQFVNNGRFDISYDTATQSTISYPANGNFDHKLIFNAQGQLQQLQQPCNDLDNPRLADITNYSYVNNQLINIVRPDNSVEQFEFNGPYQLCTKHIGPDGQRTDYLYVNYGPSSLSDKIVAKKVYLDANTILATYYVYDYNYDGRNNAFLRFVISPSGQVTEYRPTVNSGNVSSARIYLANAYDMQQFSPTQFPGLVSLENWVVKQDPQKISLTEYSYDSYGQTRAVITYTTINKQGSGMNDAGRSVSIVYRNQFGSWTTRTQQQTETVETIAEQTVDFFQRPTSFTDEVKQTTNTQYEDFATSTTPSSFTVTQPNGRQETHFYRADGLINRTRAAVNYTDPKTQQLVTQKRETNYRLDERGFTIATTTPDTKVNYTYYDGQGRLVFKVIPKKIINGATMAQVIQYQYDRVHNYKTTTQFADLLDTTTIQTLKTLSTMQAQAEALREKDVDNNMRVSYEFFDHSGNSRYIVDADLYVQECWYDNTNRKIAKIQYDDQLTADQLGLLQAGKTLSLTPDIKKDRVERYFYNDDNKLIGTQDADGYVIELKRDVSNNVIQKIVYYNPSIVNTNPAAKLSDVMPVPHVKDATTYHIYNARNLRIGTVDAEGYLTVNSYLTCGKISQSIRYGNKLDLKAWQDKTQLPTTLPDLALTDEVTTYDYDALNREIEHDVAYRPTLQSPTKSQIAVTQTYDNMRHVIQNRTQDLLKPDADDPDSVRGKEQQYDGWEQITAEANPYVAQLLIQVDKNRNIPPADKPAARAQIWQNKSTRHTYDAVSGLKLKTQDPEGNTTYFYYDENRTPILTIDGTGAVQQIMLNNFDEPDTIYRYANRLSKDQLATLTGGFVSDSMLPLLVTDPKDVVTKIVKRNKRGLVEQALDPDNNLSIYQYDAFQQKIIEQLPVNSQQPSLTVVHEFNLRGLEETTTKSVAGTDSIVVSREYQHPQGSLTKLTDERGSVADYDYDKLNRRTTTQVTLQKAQLVTQTSQVAYDSLNNVSQEIDQNNQVTQHIHTPGKRLEAILYPEPNTKLTIGKSAFSETVTLTDSLDNTQSYTHASKGEIAKHIDVMKQTTETQFNLNGDKVLQIDPCGTETALSYNPARQLVEKVVDINKLQLRTVYEPNAFGFNEKVTDPRDTLTVNESDHRNNLVKTTLDPDGLGLVKQFTVNAQNKITSVMQGDTSDANQYFKTNQLDGFGRNVGNTIDPTTSTHPALVKHAIEVEQAAKSLEIDLSNLFLDKTTATQLASPLNIQTQQHLDMVNLVIVDIDANGNVTRSFYDELKRPCFKVNAKGSVTAWDYDAVGNKLYERYYETPIDPSQLTDQTSLQQMAAMMLNHQNPLDTVIWYFYDNNKRERFQVSCLGAITEKVYNDAGWVIAEKQYYNQIDITQTLSLKSISQFVQANPHANDRATYHVYDGSKRERFTFISDSDDLSVVIEQQYNPRDQVTVKTTYYNKVKNAADLAKLDESVIASRIMSNTAERSECEKSGVVAEAAEGQDPSPIIVRDSRDQTEYTLYDTIGRKQYEINGEGAVIGYADDDDDNVTQVCRFAASLNISTDASYDQVVTLATALQPNSQNGDRISKAAFDCANRKTSFTNALNNTESFVHNACNNITQKTDYAGNTWQEEFDRANRSVATVTPEVPVTSVISDPNNPGKYTHVINWTTLRREKQLDNNGNLLQITDAVNTQYQTQLIAAYDEVNQLTVRKIPNVVVDNGQPLSSAVALSQQLNIDAPVLTATMPGRDVPVNFYEQEVSGNSSCGFIALGVTRAELTDTLLTLQNNSEKRRFIAVEILNAYLNGELAIPATIQNLLSQLWQQKQALAQICNEARALFSDTKQLNPEQLIAWLTANSKLALAEKLNDIVDALKSTEAAVLDYCQQPEIFARYINALRHSARLGYYGALLYAEAKQIQLYIWRKEEDKSSVTLLQHNEVSNPVRTVHLLHTPGSMHYNRLVEASALTNDTTASQHVNPANTVATARPENTVTLQKTKILNAKGLKIVQKNEAGKYKFYVYNSFKKLIYKVDTQGYVTQLQRNTYGEVSATIQYATPLALDFQLYQKTGLTADIIAAAIKTNPDDRTTLFTYTKRGKTATTQKDQQFYYIPNGNSAISGFASPQTRSEYDAFGNCVFEGKLWLPNPETWVGKINWFNRANKKVATSDEIQRVNLFAINAFGEEQQRIEYAKQPSSQLTADMTVADLTTVMSAWLDPEHDRTYTFERDGLGQITQQTLTGNVVVQDLVLDPITNVPSLVPRKITALVTKSRYNALQQKVVDIDANDNATCYWRDARNMLLAKTGITRQSHDAQGNPITLTPLTWYGYGSVVRKHQKPVLELSFLHGTTPVDLTKLEFPQPLQADPSVDVRKLMLVDNRNLPLYLQDAENNVAQITYTERGKIARQWGTLTNLTPGDIATVYVDETRTSYDDADQPINRALYRNNGLQYALSSQYNAFGEAIAEGLADTKLPLYTRFNHSGQVLLTNRDKGASAFQLYNLCGNKTGVIQAPNLADELSQYSENDLPAILNWDMSRRELTVTQCDQAGRQTGQLLPAFKQQQADAPLNIPLQMSVVQIAGPQLGELRTILSWPRPSETNVLPRLTIWPTANTADRHSFDDSDYQLVNNRYQVDVTDFSSDVYGFLMEHFLIDIDTGARSDTLSYTSTGKVQLLTREHDSSLSLVTWVFEDNQLLLSGNISNLTGVVLYQNGAALQQLSIQVMPTGNYLCDLSQFSSGTYTVKPIISGVVSDTPSMPFKISTSKISPHTVALSHEIKCDVEIRYLENHVALNWQVPARYSNYAISATCTYTDINQVQRTINATISPNAPRQPYNDDQRQVLYSNWEFPTDVLHIDELSLALVLDPNNLQNNLPLVVQQAPIDTNALTGEQQPIGLCTRVTDTIVSAAQATAKAVQSCASTTSTAVSSCITSTEKAIADKSTASTLQMNAAISTQPRSLLAADDAANATSVADEVESQATIQVAAFNSHTMAVIAPCPNLTHGAITSLDYTDVSLDRQQTTKQLQLVASITLTDVAAPAIVVEVTGMNAGHYPFNFVKQTQGILQVTNGGQVYPTDPGTDPKSETIQSVITYQLDRWNNQITITDALLNVTRNDFNCLNKLTQSQLPQVKVVHDDGTATDETPTTTFGISPTGVTVGWRDPKQHVTGCLVDEAGQQVAQVGALGTLTNRQVIDSLGRGTQFISASNNTTLVGYNRNSKVTSHITPTGRTTGYSYDERNNRIKEKLPGKQSRYYVYDIDNNVQDSYATGGQRSQFAYDHNKQPTYSCDPDGRTLTWSLDYWGNPESHKNLDNLNYVYLYDAKKQLTQSKMTQAIQRNKFMLNVQTMTPQQFKQHGGIFGKALANGNISVTTYTPEIVMSSFQQNITYEYAAGNRVAVYDYATNQLAKTLYDNKLRPVNLQFLTLDTQTNIRNIYTAYDALDRITQSYDGLLMLSTGYDAADNRMHVSAVTYINNPAFPHYQESWYGYDDEDRVTIDGGALQDKKIKIVLGQGVEYTYENDLRKTEHRIVPSYGDVITTHGYDGDDTLISSNDNHGTQITRGYDNWGNQNLYDQRGGPQTAIRDQSIYDNTNNWLTDDQFIQNGALLSHSSQQTYSQGGRLWTQRSDVPDQYYELLQFNYWGYEEWLPQSTWGTHHVGPPDKEVVTNLDTLTKWADENGNVYGVSGASYDIPSENLVSVFIDPTPDGWPLRKKRFLTGTDNGITAQCEDSFGSFDTQGNLLAMLKVSSDPMDQSVEIITDFMRTNTLPTPTANYQSQYQDLLKASKHSPSGQQRVANFVAAVTGAEASYNNYFGDSADQPSTYQQSYVVKLTDTFDTIAQRVYGDSRMAEAIAKANGYTTSDTPQPNTTLELPQYIPHSNSSTNNTNYSALVSLFLQNLSPFVPAPPQPHHHHSIWGMIAEAVVSAVIAIWAPELFAFVEGKVASATGAAMGLTAAATATAVVPTVVGVTVAATATAAMGTLMSATEQGLAVKLGWQDSFSLKSALETGVSAAVMGGLGYAGQLPKTAEEAADLAKVLTAAGEVAVVTQLSNMMLGLQHQFNFRDVLGQMAASVGNLEAGAKLGTLGKDLADVDVTPGLVGSLAATNLASLLISTTISTGRVDVESTLANTIGSTLGQLAGAKSARAVQDYRAEQAQKAQLLPYLRAENGVGGVNYEAAKAADASSIANVNSDGSSADHTSTTTQASSSQSTPDAQTSAFAAAGKALANQPLPNIDLSTTAGDGVDWSQYRAQTNLPQRSASDWNAGIGQSTSSDDFWVRHFSPGAVALPNYVPPEARDTTLGITNAELGFISLPGLIKDVGAIMGSAYRFFTGGAEAEVGTTGSTFYHTVTNPDAGQAVLNGINPEFFNPNSRFGEAFYLSEAPDTTLAELTYHNVVGTDTIRFSFDSKSANILDLTNPKIAKEWGYTGDDYSAAQAIAEQAKQFGFDVIRYPSERGLGTNIAVFNNFENLLRPQMIVPVPKEEFSFQLFNLGLH